VGSIYSLKVELAACAMRAAWAFQTYLSEQIEALS